MVNGKKEYPESVRQFSLKQQYYSTAAYQSLRYFFNKNLPAIRTIHMWYSSIDSSPGISRSSLDILRKKAESHLAKYGYQLHVALINDEMFIRKDLRYCQETQSFVGFSTITNSSGNCAEDDTSELKLANEALVYMVAGLDFKLAIAYELLNGLETKDRAAITLQVIKAIESVGVRVISLTGDGLAANITTAEMLGVKFNEGKTYFYSPTYPEQKIYIVLDPSHMLKLVRKHFSSGKIYHQDQLVDWNLLKMLAEKQSSDNFNLGNKLTMKHIEWHQKPMNVRMAAETISSSVADALSQLHDDGYAKFSDSRTTSEFLRKFDAAFDILNFGTHTNLNGKFKKKLNMNTASEIFQFGEEFKQYISELKYGKKPILTSSASTGFFGFYINFISLQGIYEDFVVNGPFTEFYTFQFSQDHLETYFSLVR